MIEQVLTYDTQLGSFGSAILVSSGGDAGSSGRPRKQMCSQRRGDQQEADTDKGARGDGDVETDQRNGDKDEPQAQDAGE